MKYRYIKTQRRNSENGKTYYIYYIQKQWKTFFGNLKWKYLTTNEYGLYIPKYFYNLKEAKQYIKNISKELKEDEIIN